MNMMPATVSCQGGAALVKTVGGMKELKPIIIDMKDLTDSAEVYESRPNPFMVGFIYVLLSILVTAVIWMYCSKIEIVVKSFGMFRGNSESMEVGCEYTGKVSECNVGDGQLVNKGEVLFRLESIINDDSQQYYHDELDRINERIEMLKVYEDFLSGYSDALAGFEDNAYFQEIENRKELLEANMEAGKQDDSVQTTGYQNNIMVLRDTIQTYEEKKTKYSQVLEGIKARSNPFGAEDAYFGSILNSYFSNYNYTAGQYDSKISEFQKIVNECDQTIEQLKNKRVEEENGIAALTANLAPNNVSVPELTDGIESGSDANGPDETEMTGDTADNAEITVDDTLVKQIEAELIIVEAKKKENEEKISTLCLEKQNALSTLELQQISNIQQQIETLNGNIQSAQANISTTENQIKVVSTKKETNDRERVLLNEKAAIATEILGYQEKCKEIENIIVQKDYQVGSKTVVAGETGYFYLRSEVKTGSILQAGNKIGIIYPQEEKEFHADIYVSNADIGKIQEGQEVKFEIEAYPSSEYGYFTGKVENIAKDIAVDQGSGNAYYLVRVECDNSELMNKEGKKADLMNGLACQAKIITGHERLFSYLLKMIDLVE